VLGEAAYSAGEFREHLEDNEMTAVIKPMPLRPAVEGGYTIEDFEIDRDANTVTCPNGVTVRSTRTAGPASGRTAPPAIPKALHEVKSRAHDRAPTSTRPPGAARHFAATVEFDETIAVTAP